MTATHTGEHLWRRDCPACPPTPPNVVDVATITTAPATPAEVLRAAAAKLRETATAPARSPWIRAGDLSEHYGFSEATEAWIALMHPGVAEPLAALLEAVASLEWQWPSGFVPEVPLAVARAINGAVAS